MAGPPLPVAAAERAPEGYAALSRYMDLSSELGVIRRFGTLHYRNLLYLQDELMELEERLHERDRMDGEHGSRRRDRDQVRAGLMLQLRKKLRQYDEAVASTAAMQRLQTAHKYQVQAMNAFMKAARPLVADEEAYLELEHDLVSVNPQPEDSVPSFVAAIFMATGLGRLIRSSKRTKFFKDQNLTSAHLKVFLPSQTRVKWLTRFFITFLGCLLLLVPIILLFYFQRKKDAVKLGIIVATVLAFAIITSALTSAKNWEVVAASIAYSAVLVVFVQSGVGGGTT